MADDLASRTEGLPIPRSYEPAGADAKLIRSEGDMNSLLVATHVWDSVAGAWVKAKQATLEVGDLTVTMGDLEKLAAGWYWLSTKIEFDSNTPKRIKYVGLHTTMGVATSDAGWRLIHIDYDSTSTRVTGVWKQIDAWDDRDSPATAWPT